MGGVKLGFSICYDLRFASLYRALALGGAEIIAVPSAFTVPTGEAHWEVLVRARAIETGACVIAPAQCGQHDGGRRTWGHSLIVDPWGRVLANAGPNPGIAIAMIDLEKVSETRRALPSLKHERDFTPPVSPIAGN
jgi:predicted amidohydrolase